MKIGILGYYGFNNLGDELNLQGMMEILKGKFGNPEFLIFSDCQKIEGDVAYRIVGKNYIFPDDISIKDVLNSCDLLVIGGGGLIYLGEFWFPFIDKEIKVPYIIFRVGIDDGVVDADAVKQYKKMFLNAKEVTVRDAYSLKLCKQYLTDQVTKVPEAIWNHPYKYPKANKNSTKNIGVNLRSFSEEIYPVLKTFFDYLREQGYKLYFIPCQVSEQSFALNDNNYHRMVASDKDDIMPDNSTIGERCKLISEMDICIGMRLHFILIALSQRVPAMALNYNNKVKALMEEVNLSSYLVDLKSDKLLESLKSVFAKLVKEYDSIKSGI